MSLVAGYRVLTSKHLNTLDRQLHAGLSGAAALLLMQIPAFLNSYQLNLKIAEDILFDHLAVKVKQCALRLWHSSAPVTEYNLGQKVEACLFHHELLKTDLTENISIGPKSPEDFTYEAMKDLASRWKHVRVARRMIAEASLFTKPWEFLRSLQWGTAKKTLSEYRFSLSVSSDSFFYGLMGLVIGSTLYTLAYQTLKHLNKTRGDKNE